jgi:hypothetical protein
MLLGALGGAQVLNAQSSVTAVRSGDSRQGDVPTGTISTFDVPGATSTTCMGISAAGIVGCFIDIGGFPRGFSYDDRFVSFGSVVAGIDEIGNWVGGNGPGCLTPGTGECTGFLITTESQYFEIRPRGSVSAMAFGIVNTGYLSVVGADTDVDGAVHGFLDGSYPIDPPAQCCSSPPASTTTLASWAAGTPKAG